MHKVFVYGTLRPGTSDTVLVPGKIYDLGWFPGVVLGGDDHAGDTPSVVCEVIAVDDAGLSRLDDYEGYYAKNPEDSLYIRDRYQDGFIYRYNGDVSGRPLVPSGDWLEYTGKSSGTNSHLGAR